MSMKLHYKLARNFSTVEFDIDLEGIDDLVQWEKLIDRIYWSLPEGELPVSLPTKEKEEEKEEKPSEKQIDFAKKLGIKYEGMSKKDLQQAIKKKIESKQA